MSRFFASERREHHSTVCRYDPISCNCHAICRCQLCTALLQILPDGRAPCNELMLHHAMQCTGASCRMLQIPSNFAADSTQLRGSCFYPGMVLHANTFMRRCFFHRDAFIPKNFCTQTRGYLYAQMPLNGDAFTEECFYTHVRLHRASFGTN